jgi:hypothetical protein
MSKANQLRDALRKHNNRLPYADALKIVGTRGGMSFMIANGEIEVIDEDEGKFVTLDPNFKVKQALPIKRKKSKRAGGKKKHSKAPRKAVYDPRPFKKLAEKFAETAQIVSITTLALNNLIASAENLAATLRREVEGVETNPNLMAAIETQERAAEIARAA